MPAFLAGLGCGIFIAVPLGAWLGLIFRASGDRPLPEPGGAYEPKRVGAGAEWEQLELDGCLASALCWCS